MDIGSGLVRGSRWTRGRRGTRKRNRSSGRRVDLEEYDMDASVLP